VEWLFQLDFTYYLIIGQLLPLELNSWQQILPCFRYISLLEIEFRFQKIFLTALAVIDDLEQSSNRYFLYKTIV
jgi:hypothetical protein